MPSLSSSPARFIYLIVIVLLRQFDDAIPLHRESRPQLRRLRRKRWLQIRASGYHRRRRRTPPWRIKLFKWWRIFVYLVEERTAERTPG